jgi:hypothetical protein
MKIDFATFMILIFISSGTSHIYRPVRLLRKLFIKKPHLLGLMIARKESENKEKSDKKESEIRCITGTKACFACGDDPKQ